MMQKILNPFQRLVRWFFGAPFQELPPEFGDTVPPDLRAFEAEAHEMQHHPQGSVHPSNSGGRKNTGSHH